MSAPASPPPTNLAASVRRGVRRPRSGGAGANAFSISPMLARLISRMFSPFNGELPLSGSAALDLAGLASNAALNR